MILTFVKFWFQSEDRNAFTQDGVPCGEITKCQLIAFELPYATHRDDLSLICEQSYSFSVLCKYSDNLIMWRIVYTQNKQ